MSKINLTEEASSPATPSAGQVLLYPKTDGSLYSKDDTGTETLLAAPGAVTSLTGDVTGTGPGATATTISALAVTNSKIANSTIDLAAKVTGVLPVANGGTNASAALNNNRVIQSSGGALVEAAAITASRALASDGSGIPVASATTAVELGYLSGVTSAVQTQINGKQATGNYITDLTGDVTASGPGSVAATIAALAVTNAKIANATIDLTAKVTGTLPVANGGTNSATALSNNRVMQSSGGAVVEATAITAARALISDANGIPVHSAVTATELGYVAGVTSAIQTQLNGKGAAFGIVAVAGDVTLTANAIHTVSSAAARNLTLPAHVAGQRIYIKDSTGSCETNNFTLIRTGGGNIDGIAASRTLQTNWGSWHLVDDGTDWFFV